jgi:1-acyl-sn-glycerol-3-phosphate acyltransferase
MNFIYRLVWLLIRLLLYTYFHGRYFHAHRVPLTGPVILAANHASFLDPPLIGGGFNRAVNYLARNTLMDVPVLGALLRRLNVVPVDRDGGGGAGLKAILDRLLVGGVILLFPEGTRTRDGKLQPAKSGIGLTVIKSTATVVPVRVHGTFAALGRHMKFPLPRRVTVTYGEPLDFRALREEARTCSKPRLKEIYQQVADEIMAAIANLDQCADSAVELERRSPTGCDHA